MSITFDTREFDATLKEYMRHNKRDTAEICNDRAARVCQSAIKHTVKADREKIVRLLTANATMTATKIRVDRKTGRFKAGKALVQHTSGSGQNSVAARLVNYFRDREGLHAIHGKQLQEAATKLLTRRLRSIGYAKSGWIAALKQLLPWLPKKLSASSPGVRLVSSRGRATPARPGDQAFAEIVNEAASKYKGGEARGLEEVITEGLKAGFQAEERNMRVYIEAKLQKTADRYNAK